MLRKGTGDTSAPSSTEYEAQNAPIRRPRGLLKLLQGQIPTHGVEKLVDVYRFHGETLRETQTKLQKRRARSTDHNSETDLFLPKHSMTFESVVQRHKFVAFFVVQGFRNAAGNTCYSAHTLKLRSILATDYHDVMTTFVLDLAHDSNPAESRFGDEETGTTSCNNGWSFCNGTGFCLFPTSGSVSTLLALLNVSKIPAVVVLDAFRGRIVAQDAILAMERNDGHTVVNRWQSGKSGLSILQQLGAVATCDCSHGPCCSGSGGGCCVVQ